MKKRILSAFLALAMGAALCVPAFAAEAKGNMPFTDVAEDHWAYDDIQYCYGNGLFVGKSETSFDPNGKMTVSEAVMLAGRLCDLTNGGDGVLTMPDLAKPFARFYDENGELIAALDHENMPAAVGAMGNLYIALTNEENDTSLPESCIMELGLDGLLPASTYQGVWQTYEHTGGHMSYGLQGTGYIFEDEEAGNVFRRAYDLVYPDTVASACVNEWWYPANLYLRFYSNYGAITEMCYHMAIANAGPNGFSNTDYDALGTFTKEPSTRAMFACLINAAVSDELGVINEAPIIPDVDPDETHDAEAILRLYSAGIIGGVDGTGRFNGSGELTRAEAATILARVLNPEARLGAGSAGQAAE